MAQQELDLGQRLTLAYQARQDFAESIEVASTVQGGDVMNALVEVAHEMFKVDMPPVRVLERLTDIRDRRFDQRDREFIELGMADVHAMLGNFSKLPNLLSKPYAGSRYYGSSVYVFAAELEVKNHQDPTPILEKALEGKGYLHHLIEIARVYHQVGKVDQAREILTKAEGLVVEAKKTPPFDERYCEDLAAGYTQIGYSEDGLRMIDFLKDNKYKPYYQGKITEIVARKQAARGDFDEAVQTADMLKRKRLLVHLLSQKLIADARTSPDIYADIDRILEILGDREYPELYEDVYPNIGLALADAGEKRDSKMVFDHVKNGIDCLDVMYRGDAGFALAEAMDRAGFEAEPIYRRAFGWADEFRWEDRDLDEHFGVSYSMHLDGIQKLINRGHFIMAREFLTQLPLENWYKSGLIATLARREAEKGLSEQEISQLSQDQIRAILLTGNEMAQKAVKYFGLDKGVI